MAIIREKVQKELQSVIDDVGHESTMDVLSAISVTDFSSAHINVVVDYAMDDEDMREWIRTTFHLIPKI